MSKLLIIFSLLLVIVSFGLFLIMPKYQNLMLFKTQVYNRQAELILKEEHIANLEATVLELENYPEEVIKIHQSLPSDPKASLFLDFLQEKASEHGLIFEESVFFEKSTSKYNKEVREARIGVKVAGRYSGFLDFISDMEKLSRMAQTTYITFVTPEESSIFTFELNIKLPFLQNNELEN